MSLNILSLFDGISCAQIALGRAGIKCGTYYAAEVDKWAVQITQHNYPETVQLGDVTKWREWDIDWSSIGFVSAGFPCQSWSLAGKQLGDKDERGMLFWVMLDIIAHVLEHNPDAKFMMENVRMKREFEEYITHHTEQALGAVHKTLINSALVSAQNRNRYYWTNFEVGQPEDKGLVLADILEHGVVDRDKSHCIDANYFKGGNLKSYFEKNRRQLVFNKPVRTGVIGKGRQGERIYSANGKSPTLLCNPAGGNKPLYHGNVESYRKLTPLECERLQTVPDNYTLVTDAQGKQLVSNTQRYKALGNGFTVDVIAHILSHAVLGK